jgi:hypothetical protein
MASSQNPPIFTFQVAGIISVNHHTQPHHLSSMKGKSNTNAILVTGEEILGKLLNSISLL